MRSPRIPRQYRATKWLHLADSWRLRQEPLTDVGDYLAALSQRWDRAIVRLRAFVDDES